MKRIKAVLPILLFGLVAAGCVFWLTGQLRPELPRLNGDDLSKKVREVHGLSAEQVHTKLGEPYRVVSREEYDSTEQRDLAVSYEPDPPTSVEMESVMLYREGLRMAALYLRNDRVVLIWEGLT